MHISEGVLSPAVIGAGLALTALGTGIGLRRAGYERLTTTAVLSSVFFVGTLVHIPLGPGSVHLVLNGLLGLFLGWGVFPALLVALLLQTMLFGYGGIAVLGVNVFDVAFPALLCHGAFRGMVNGRGFARAAGAFLCGALSVAGAAVCVALALALSERSFFGPAKILLLAHIPVMLIEGAVTALAVAFIAKTRPELLRSEKNETATGGEPS